jgi:hypothetical protein
MTTATADDLRFEAFACPEPEGDWEYIVDDWGILYGPGRWPFYRIYNNELRPERNGKKEPTSVRLNSDTGYENGVRYVLLFPPQNDGRTEALIHVAVRPQGMGFYMADAVVQFDLAGSFEIDRCPDIARPQVEDRARKILTFLAKATAERDKRKRKPETAYDNWRQD